MAIHIEFSQYGDAVEARITDGISHGCELIKWTKEKIGTLLWKRLEGLGVPTYLVCESWGKFTTNNLKLFDEIFEIGSMSEFLDTNPVLYLPWREVGS